MIVKFITMKGASNIAAAPFYVGFVQHDRTMSRRETYEYCAERTGFKAAAIRAVFMALAETSARATSRTSTGSPRSATT